MKISSATIGIISVLMSFLANQVSCQTFEERALQWGIEHYHRGTYGGGVAIFDYNNDGYEDIYLTGGHFRDKLYKNNGNHSFTDITLHAGFAETSKSNTMSVTVGDINNDGYKDLFIGTFRGQTNLLFLNNGDHTFSEIGKEAKIDRAEWAIGASFGDFNLDGLLDLYIINYIADESLTYDEEGEVNGFDHDCFPNRLFFNNGDLTFSEITSESINNAGCGLAVASTDLNNDHVPDIYVANDFGAWITPNAGLQNNFPESSFTDVSAIIGLDAAIYGMGVAVGDYDRDGLLDYYVTNLGANVLYHNTGNGQFYDVAESAGVLNTFAGEKLATSWGTAFFDYDLDGFEDLFVANGYVPAASFISTARDDPNQLYRNLGNGTFQDIADSVGLNDLKSSRGMAVGDLDNDGDFDIVVTVVGESREAGNVLIYENMINGDNNWMKVMLRGMATNFHGFGGKVIAYDNEITWIHEVEGGSSHASQNSSLAHFGLGQTLELDSLVVIWPGGKGQKITNVPVNQNLVIEENTKGYFVAGCMESMAENYDPAATFNYGCFIKVTGCMDQLSPGFNIEANTPIHCDRFPLGVEDNEKIVVFPNPANERVTVIIPNHTGQNVHVRILSISGSVIDQKEGKNRICEIDLTGIDPGIYLLSIMEAQHAGYIKRIIVR